MLRENVSVKNAGARCIRESVCDVEKSVALTPAKNHGDEIVHA